ncbi:hypothetical protein RBB68_00530 [Leptospira interrogans]|uniref:Uncharacterized protein n=15 Tax=Leptospira interrogans TaxID=173 RepID=Q8F9S4_LEPIN|nr:MULTISPECIES: hypothetical protein [Leptospira]APH40117.1 Uncharacterized protein A9P81_0137 [Leptospira interrogans serovar Copenhageni/Icterohaemorrhagiae]EMF72280.1 hypothetical protein LEP1GSC148_3108 [Leptospira interrogans serovar Canicola str. LT1962]EMM93466.1 hypothetical protein LEP1GSC158_4525 [Leptospira interrogans serovar Zanoni str. LT2156]EMP08540.1 hypothetical protein LEP1GSC124_2939 [Leptospira interrogans serovar Pyrogenes str. 200701872]KAA1268572.1 hypothetical protein
MKFKTILKNKIKPYCFAIFLGIYLFSHEKIISSKISFFLKQIFIKRNMILVLFGISFFNFCKSSHETFIEEIQELVEQEKYEKASEKLKEKLQFPKDRDELLSAEAPESTRIIEFSNDRLKLVWTEDQKIFFQDLAAGENNSRSLDQIPSNLSLSQNANYALVEYTMQASGGCRYVAISLKDSSLSYEAGAQVSCKSRGSILPDGSKIYYFVDDNLYEEKTVEPRKPVLVLQKEKIVSPFPNLKTRFLMYPSGNSFLIFSGNAGAYNLYWFHPFQKTAEKIDKDILSPILYYGNGESAYYIGGEIGKLHLRRINFSSKAKPVITKLFTVSRKEINPWKLSKKNEFLSGYSGKVHLWGPAKKSQNLPILCERVFLTGDDRIVCEAEPGQLFLSKLDFQPEDWSIWKLYEEVRSK